MQQTWIAAAALALATPALGAGFGFERQITLTPIGSYASGAFDEGAAEIVAYAPKLRRAFVVNALSVTVDVLDISDPTRPVKVDAIDVTQAAPALGAANSVDVSGDLVAVAVEADDKQAPGIVAFYDAESLALLGTVEVGALPDMVTFTPDGKRVLVANEGEPNDDYTIDPEGSVSVIDIRRGIDRARVRTADFRRFNDQRHELIEQGVRIFGPGASVAQDLEPEFIAVEPNGRTAWVSLQEANALAEVDVNRARIRRIVPLGYKDHSAPLNELDASDRDGAINIANWPILGMYQPDSIAVFRTWFGTFILTANEGDARDYDGFAEESRLKDFEDEGLALDPNVFPNAAELLEDENLGRLTVTTVNGDADGDGLYEEIYAFGGRSFSIWDTRGNLVFDSGAEFEQITASLLPDYFNASNDNSSFDNRSDNKGPEPEGVDVGWYLGRLYAFIGLERIGGIMVYDITNPYAPEFVTYANNRDFTVAPCLVVDADGDCEPGAGNANPAAGDLGPEGIKYVPWFQSPTWRPLVIVGNEISGTTTVFELGIRFTR